MTANINPETGIAYGFISDNSLDSDIVQELLYGGGATDRTYKDGLADHLRQAQDLHRYGGELDESLLDENGELDEDAVENEFNELYASDEPSISGTHAGVSYETSYMGGAMCFFIFESPHVTSHALRASPCVPNAGILDTLDGDVTSYDVPADWRHSRG